MLVTLTVEGYLFIVGVYGQVGARVDVQVDEEEVD